MAETNRDFLSADALPEEGGVREVELAGEKWLLVRDAAGLRALTATCPHAGAPLAQGVRNGDRLVCPWHKATFCLRTGRVLEPPALDALPMRPARIENGRIRLEPAASPPKPAIRTGDARCFVIAGAGAAGAMAAQTLREAGFGGKLLLLDVANRVPYDRTLLSKYHLSGEKGAEKSPLQPQSWWRAQHIERRTAEITKLDAPARRIECGSETIAYDAALIATGARPIQPDLPGARLPNVFLLRSRADADALLAAAERSSTAAVLGASFIGMEVAASLRERGLDVTVIAQQSVPFEKTLGREVGHAFVRLHEKRGVRFRLQTEVERIEPAGVCLRVGETVAADLVVIGFGVRPATGFVHGIALQQDGGIAVDAELHAAEALWAAGDVAAFPLPGNGPRIRVEHWRVAQQHGRIAALNMLGAHETYTAPPLFWTIQYRKRLDYIGHAAEWDHIELHGDPEKPEFLAYYLKNGTVAAACGMDRDRDMAALAEWMRDRSCLAQAELGHAPAEKLASPQPTSACPA